MVRLFVGFADGEGDGGNNKSLEEFPRNRVGVVAPDNCGLELGIC